MIMNSHKVLLMVYGIRMSIVKILRELIVKWLVETTTNKWCGNNKGTSWNSSNVFTKIIT